LNRVKAAFDEITTEGPAHPLVAGAAVKLYMYNRGTAAEIDRRDRDIKKQQRTDAAFDSTIIHYKGPESP